VLSQHGLTSTSMNVAKLMYCASAWSGLCLAADRERLDTFLRRCKRLRYSDGDIPDVFDSTTMRLCSVESNEMISMSEG